MGTGNRINCYIIIICTALLLSSCSTGRNGESKKTESEIQDNGLKIQIEINETDEGKDIHKSETAEKGTADDNSSTNLESKVFEQKDSGIDKKSLSPEEAKKIIQPVTNDVIAMIKNKDFVGLSTVTHSVKGIRFTAYTNVNNEQHVFSVSKIKDFFKDKNKYIWGHYFGSGEPIKLTPEEYYKDFIYDADFAKAEIITYNQIARDTGIKENQFEFYPGSIIVEYYFPGFKPEFGGLDWTSLRLVYESYDGKWVLAGIIHNEWTP